MVTDDDGKLSELYQNDMVNESKSPLKKFLMCSALLLSSCESVLIFVENVSWCHLLEGAGNVLIAAIDELAGGCIVGNPLGLP